MKRLRIVFLLPGMILEMVLLAACGGCAFVRLTGSASAILRWSTRTLPSIDWYLDAWRDTGAAGG